jgi:hypothetical protein
MLLLLPREVSLRCLFLYQKIMIWLWVTLLMLIASEFYSICIKAMASHHMFNFHFNHVCYVYPICYKSLCNVLTYLLKLHGILNIEDINFITQCINTFSAGRLLSALCLLYWSVGEQGTTFCMVPHFSSCSSLVSNKKAMYFVDS